MHILLYIKLIIEINIHKTLAFYENLCYNIIIVTVKLFIKKQEEKIMAEMKMHVEMLQGLSKDLRACVDGAKERKEAYEQEISTVSGEQAASQREMKSIKQSFSLTSWFKSKFSSISAAEARQVAERYGKYAEVVDQIADENQRMEDAKMSLSTAEDDLAYSEEVLAQTDRLIGMLGRLPQ